MITRREDWPEKLAEFVENSRGAAFEWGVNDCALRFCDAVLAMTDVDLGAALRGKYSSALGAAKAMADFCGAPNVEAVAEEVALEHDIAEIPVLMAQRGDAVLFDTEAGPAIAFVGLNGMSAEFFSPDGPAGGGENLVQIKISACRRAWRI